MKTAPDNLGARATWFIVSTSPTQIVATDDDDREINHYVSKDEAEDAIRNGYHGEYGSLYVHKVETEVVSTATRSWTLVAKPA